MTLLPSVARAKDTYSQPDGISGTSIKLEDLLAAAHKADGGDKTPTSSVEEGRVTAWGLQGTFRDVTAGDDFKWTTDLGVASWSSGRVNGQNWRENPNGVITQLHGLYPVLDAGAIQQYRGYNVADLELLGETSGPSAAYVVEAHPKARRLMWLFFNKKNYIVTRVELAFPDQRLSYTYGDFRKTGPYTNAWHVHSSDGYPPNDIDYVTVSKKYNIAVNPSDTAMPLQNDKLVLFPAGSSAVRLPSRLTGENDAPTIVSRQDITQSTSETVAAGASGAGSSPIGGGQNGGNPAQTPNNTGQNGMGGVGVNGTLSDTTRNALVIPKAAGKNVVVQLTIGGRAYDFYLDTGASGVVIDSDVVAALGLKTLWSVRANDERRLGPFVRDHTAGEQRRYHDDEPYRV